MTSSPGPISIASSASTSASVPFATPTVRGTPRCAAASASNAWTFGPRMNGPESAPAAIRSWICGIRRSYWALTLTSGVSGTTGLESREPPEYQVQHEQRGSCQEREVEGVVKTLVVAAEGVTGAGQREGPDRRPERRQPEIRPERHAEDAGRNRDERAHDRRDPAEQDGPAVVPVEPALRPAEALGPEGQQPPMALRERPPAGAADPPADHRAEQVAQRPGERHRHVRPAAGLDAVAEEHDVLRGEGARGERARIDHHQLAGSREDRVDRHQQEDRVDAVVADEGRNGAGDRREHAPSLWRLSAERRRSGSGRPARRRSGRRP